MSLWKKLLVPTDFSDGARDALALAVQLARVHGASITLLHVVEVLPGLGAETMILPENATAPVKLLDFARQQADTWMQRDREALSPADVPMTLTLETGQAEDAILKAAAREKSDVIVMGTRGRTGLAHLVLGSVTERVVRHAEVPVITVRSRAG